MGFSFGLRTGSPPVEATFSSSPMPDSSTIRLVDP